LNWAQCLACRGDMRNLGNFWFGPNQYTIHWTT